MNLLFQTKGRNYFFNKTVLRIFLFLFQHLLLVCTPLQYKPILEVYDLKILSGTQGIHKKEYVR